MANIIKPKRSESTGQTPTLSPGELAVNIADKKVWVANSSGTPVLIVDGNASVSETDPIFTASASYSITTSDITNWNTAYGWGDHASAGYLTTETDPIFAASAAFSITTTDTGNWNTAYGWGDHSSVGYLTIETDPIFTASDAASITATDIGNWNTAYGWGDHASAGYLTTETDPVFSASDAASITATDISNWNAKPDSVAITSTGNTITVTDNTVGGAVSYNLETPQGIATTDSPSFAGLTVASLIYPSADGTSGQVIVTDGAGNLSFATAGGGGTTITAGNLIAVTGTSPSYTIGVNSSGLSTAIYSEMQNYSPYNGVALSTSSGGTGKSLSPANGSMLTALSGAFNELAIGSQGHILTVNTSGVPAWETNGIFSAGRLTLTSGSPTPTTDQTSKSVVYYTPYNGHRISLYNGISWMSYTLSEISLTLSGLTAAKNYDIFIYSPGGTTLSLEALAWTNDTTRATALTLQNGVYVRFAATSKRYVGTIRTTSTTTTEDSISKRFVWNVNNRVEKPMYKNGTTSHTYTTASWRNWNNDATLRVEFVIGIDAAQVIHFGGASTGTSIDIGAAFDGSTPGYDSINSTGSGVTQNRGGRSYSSRGFYLGYHYCQMQEYGATGTTFLDARLEGTIWS